VIGDIDIAEKNHTQLTEIILALLGIAPVSKNCFTWLPNSRCSVTQRYIFSFDRMKQTAERIRKTVPGNPGRKYPAIPIPKNTKPMK
jgi:hypothetical protein